MKYVLLIVLFLSLPDSLKVEVEFDPAERETIQEQTVNVNRGIDSLSLKLDMLIKLLENDSIIKK